MSMFPPKVSARCDVHISAIYTRICKMISPSNSPNFSTSDRMDETNFGNPIFSGLDPPFGVVDVCLVEP